MSKETEYPSKLRQRASGGGPMRGIGSAYAQNQRIAGAQDPEAAAALAKMDPEEARRLLEQAERLNAQADDQRAEMLRGPGVLPELDRPDLEEYLAKLMPPAVDMLYQRFQEAQKDAIDDEVAKTTQEALSSNPFRISPDDPLYDPLQDQDRRKHIEEGLEPLSFEDMVFLGYCDQDVKLRENYVLTFRTISTQHGLWLESMLNELRNDNVQYGRHWFSLLQVACSLQSINGKEIGTDLSALSKAEQRRDFKTALEKRMEFLGRMPGQLTDDLIVQYTWFVGRVRKLLSGNLLDKVGNS